MKGGTLPVVILQESRISDGTNFGEQATVNLNIDRILTGKTNGSIISMP